jgi:hypothetical protein
MSEWLYQYWFFCFKTAKHWGRGPLAWKAELLDFGRFKPSLPRSLPGTPHESLSRSDTRSEHTLIPTNLCRWFVHVYNVGGYEPIPDEEERQDFTDQVSWPPWPANLQDPPISTRLRDALEHNDFTLTPAATLPVAIPSIAKAAERSPDELLLEALGFSIISRHEEQVGTILRQLRTNGIDCTSLYPFHMATSYLDGSRSCCNIFKTVSRFFSGARMTEVYVNELGHTILDNLMILILKSHSSTRPNVVDQAWKDNPRFCGEEVDICGRWDADSPCVRQQHANGNPTTPMDWKHKFCHTSTQTICHCLILLFAISPERLIRETASGLYVHRCFECGMKLQLQPLHSLIITAYHLASKGCQDEDMFGMLACLLCLISNGGLDPQQKANVSVNALLGNDALVECDHEYLTAPELAERVSAYSGIESWSTVIRSGWVVFCGVLSLCERNYPELRSNDDNEEDKDDEENEDYGMGEEWWDDERDFVGDMEYHEGLRESHAYNVANAPALVQLFRKRKDIGTLWASIQAELLTYRRLDHGMNWLSPNFSMERLQSQLAAGEPLSVGFADQSLLHTHCVCGDFDVGLFALLSDVTDPNLANLDHRDAWERTTYGTLWDDY